MDRITTFIYADCGTLINSDRKGNENASNKTIISLGDGREVDKTTNNSTKQQNSVAQEEKDESVKEDTVFVKMELMEEDEDLSYGAPVSLLVDGDPILPLDVQIAEDEETDGGGVGELPVKIEIAEVTDENGEPVVLCEEDDSNKTDIKVELLEESYEDRINDFLRAVNTQEYQNGVGSADESDNDASSAHFLTRASGKQKRKRELTCENCSASFKYQSTYDYHVRSQCGTKMIADTNRLVKKGKNQSFTCNVCKKEMCSRTSLMVHMRIHNGERPFICVVCSRSFIQKAHLKDHMKIHAEGKPSKPLAFTCSECGQVFNEKRFLQSHMQVHFGNKVYDCNVCHKRFRTRSNLSNHKIIHSEKRDFSCTVCGKGFFRKINLDDHMRVHTKEKPFACDLCGKRFSEKNRRNTHVKRHTGELNQVCSYCDKKFACSYDLRVHQRMHTGEKPFSCNICGRMFNRKAIMETHMTIHTGRKDFICTQCGEAFNRKSKLDVHLASHTGEKFHCEICHRVFKCKAYLVPHVRTHFGQGRRRPKRALTSCILCSKEFSSSKLLQNHLIQAHTTFFQPRIPTAFVKAESLVQGDRDL